MPSFYHRIGDRVQRLVDVCDSKSPLRRGTIIERYSYQSDMFGYYPELYRVRWDDGTVEKGFLPHGLHKEVK